MLQHHVGNQRARQGRIGRVLGGGGLVAALLAALVAMVPLTASAAPQTEAIPLATLDPAPTTGSLANQIDWDVNVGVWNAGGQGYAFLNGDGLQTWTFDKPVSVRFGIAGLNLSGECVEVPEGTIVEQIAVEHSYDAITRRVCRQAGALPATESTFTHPGPLGALVLDAVGGTGTAGRGPTFIEVTYDQPVSSIAGPENGGTSTEGDGTVLEFSCDDGTGEVSGSATIDGEPIDNGAEIDALGPGEHTIEVTCTDEHGATHTTSVTFTVEPRPAPACVEDGLAVLQFPHSVYALPGSGALDVAFQPATASGLVHQVVEPTIAAVVDPITALLGLPVSPLVHLINCQVVVPVEDVVDAITIPLVTQLKVQAASLLAGLL